MSPMGQKKPKQSDDHTGCKRNPQLSQTGDKTTATANGEIITQTADQKHPSSSDFDPYT